jgi:hypothetical protein
VPPWTSWLTGTLSTLHRPDQLGEVGQRTTELAAENADQRGALLGGGAVVDKQDDLPAAGEDVAGDVVDHHRAAPGDVDAGDLPAVDVVGDDAVALPAVGVLPDPAGAQHVAGADLQQGALQRVDRT